MELSDLNHEERLALVGLAKLIVQADQVLSAGEELELDRLAAAMGQDLFNRSVDEAQERFQSQEEIRHFASTITGQPARELIFELLCNLALPGTISPEESEELEWLCATWEIKRTVLK